MCHRASWDTPEPLITCEEEQRDRPDEYRALGDAEYRSRITGSGMVYDRQLTANDEPYKLKSILEEKAPAGTEGIGWHRYVITQGKNTITGHRQGSREGVTVAVEEILVQLNERRLHKLLPSRLR